METFDITPFQSWLRDRSLVRNANPGAPSAPIPPPPPSFVCGVWVNRVYKFLFIRNRKTASSTFITAIRRFMSEQGLCSISKDPDRKTEDKCFTRIEPLEWMQEGKDLDAVWREYLVITGTRNPWARAASGYQYTYDKWTRKDGSCAQPTFEQFCRYPFIMGMLSNMFNCASQPREGVGSRHEGHWNFDFCHVEPASACMVDDAGKLVVDFVIRYERLDEDIQEATKVINARRPAGVPAIEVPPGSKWRNKNTATKSTDINSTDAAAFVYADKYRQCGAACANAIADFYATDLKLFGWDRPGPPPPT